MKRRLEPGGEHEHVELVQPAVDGPHAVGLDPVDRVGHQLGVGPLDRVVEVRRDDQALAPGAVVGPQLLAQLGSATLSSRLARAAFSSIQDLGRVGVDDRVGEALHEVGVQFCAQLGQ